MGPFRSQGRSPREWISTPIKGLQRVLLFLPSCKDMKRKQALTRHKIGQCLGLGLLALRLVRNTYLLFIIHPVSGICYSSQNGLRHIGISLGIRKWNALAMVQSIEKINVQISKQERRRTKNPNSKMKQRPIQWERTMTHF